VEKKGFSSLRKKSSSAKEDGGKEGGKSAQGAGWELREIEGEGSSVHRGKKEKSKKRAERQKKVSTASEGGRRRCRQKRNFLCVIQKGVSP